MPAVVSLLEEPVSGRLRSLWEGLEREFGIEPPAFPPHLTYHAANAYDLEQVGGALKSIARSLPPFAVAAEGLGLFLTESKALYVPVVRTHRLALLQRTVVEEVRDHARDGSSHYQPDRWLPHLTLAQGAFSPEQIGAMVAWLARQELSFDVTITNVAAIDGEGAAVIARYELSA